METSGSEKAYRAFRGENKTRLIQAYHLPVTHGIDIFIELNPERTIDARSFSYGCSDESRQNIIQNGNRWVKDAVRAAEAYFHAKLDSKARTALGEDTDTAKCGWLEKFLIDGSKLKTAEAKK